jgi:tight adherence protein B
VLTAVACGGALALGVHPGAVAVVALATYRPLWFLGAAGAWGVIARVRRPAPPGPDDEAALLRALAAELRSGQSLRAGLEAAARRVPRLDVRRAVRLAAAGVPAAEVGAALEDALPVNGRLAGAAFRLAVSTGAGAAGVFAALAHRAAAAGEAHRELRALTAQARLSALVVGGAPLLVAVLVAGLGNPATLMAPGPGRAAVAVGLGLELAGLATVWLMARGPHR